MSDRFPTAEERAFGKIKEIEEVKKHIKKEENIDNG